MLLVGIVSSFHQITYSWVGSYYVGDQTSVHLYLRVDLFHQVPQIYLQTDETLAQIELRLPSFVSSLLSPVFRRIPLSLQLLALSFQVSPEGLEVVRGQTQTLIVLTITNDIRIFYQNGNQYILTQ